MEIWWSLAYNLYKWYFKKFIFFEKNESKVKNMKSILLTD